MRVANDPEAGAVELAVAIGTDPALSARIIRTVNAAAYGLRRKATRLIDATTLLGVKRVRNLAIASLVCDLFRSGYRFGLYDRQRLWQHMVGVAIGSRCIASAVGQADPEEVFLAGLLHDIGIILEDQYAHDSFLKVVTSASSAEAFHETEQRILGFDHTELGERVAALWSFPDSVVDAIANHHNADEYRGPSERVVLAVALANRLCTDLGVTATGFSSAPVLSPSVLERLGVQEDDLPVFADDLQAELSSGDLLTTV
jgi:putative nucleotidyltransferase with HDIG domain